MTQGRDKSGFLSRWSRRKSDDRDPALRRADLAGEPAPNATMGRSDAASPAAEPDSYPPAITEEELAALPPVESAVNASDLAGYLRRGVPVGLRLLAMRRMWSLNPAIRGHVDPALDYAFDFNTPGAAPWSPLGQGFDAQAAADRLLGRGAAPEAGREPGAAVDGVASDVDADVDVGHAPRPERAASPDAVADASGGEPPVRTNPASDDQRPTVSAPTAFARRHGGAVPI